VSPTANLTDAGAVVDLFEEAAGVLRGAPRRSGAAVRLPATGRLLATGDLHDNPFHLAKIIAAARLEASADHHVVLHELIHGERLVNGMDFSYRMLARIAELVRDHPDQVHPLLANHELAQMTGKGVSKGAGNSVELFRDALDYVFGEAACEVEDASNAFIRAMPLALLTEEGVCCAHSLPASHAMSHFDPAVLDRELVDEDYVGPHGAAYLMTWGRNTDDADVDRLAEAWNVRLFCLGHEHVETGIEVRGERRVILNSDHERATVLPLDLGDLPPAAEALMYGLPLASIPAPPAQE
jgi:hypothetical protein